MKNPSLAAAILFLLPLPLLRADVVTLKDGRVLEGRVEKLADRRLKVTGAKGATVVGEDEVLSMDAAESLLKAYEARLRETPETAVARTALGRWCRERGLEVEAREQFLSAAILDPEFSEAREALGYQKVDGVWMAAADRRELESGPKQLPKSAVSDGSAVVEGRAAGWTPDHKGLIVEAARNKVVAMDACYVRVGIPLVTLELRPTFGQLKALRTVFTSGAVTTVAGNQQNIFIEAPITQLNAVRTTAQVAAYP